MKGSSISCIHDFYLGIIMQKFDLGSNAEINPLLTLQNNTDAQFLEPKKVFFCVDIYRGGRGKKEN